EEELLPNCLNSIKNVADEVIIVDTGSTDHTITIANNFGAKIYHHPWNDSFSEARNHSLSYASGDWILQIDAEEELEQADIPKLQSAINNPRYNGIIVAIHSTIKDNVHKFYNTRIFRRGKGFYKDIIHEQIITEGERLPTEIRLYHHGYNLDEKRMQIKWERTTRLLKKQIEQNKSNSFAWFNLIRNYRSQGLFQDGINAGEEALKIITLNPCSKNTGRNDNTQHYAMITYETAHCYLHQEDFVRARELCDTTLSILKESGITSENVDITFTLACTYLKEGSYKRAIDYFKRFLSLREWYLKNMDTNSLMIDTLGYDYAAHNGMGYCFGNLGQWETSINHLQKAISCNPKYLTAYRNLASYYSSIESYNNATNILLKAISEGIADDEVLLRLGELYIHQKVYEKATPYLEEYLKKHPENKSILLKLAWLYEKSGHLEAALLGYRSVRAGSESHEGRFRRENNPL
ncbi:partial SPbeta prophage-derived glycosyltransferase SunS, partial [uncultured bacterium]